MHKLVVYKRISMDPSIGTNYEELSVEIAVPFAPFPGLRLVVQGKELGVLQQIRWDTKPVWPARSSTNPDDIHVAVLVLGDGIFQETHPESWEGYFSTFIPEEVFQRKYDYHLWLSNNSIWKTEMQPHSIYYQPVEPKAELE